MANMQLFLNNFAGVFVASVKDAPVSGTPATELDYGILRLSDGVAGVLLDPTSGDYYILTAYKKVGTTESGIEIMRVTDVDNSVPGECRITVLRGQEGTPVQAYVSGDYVAMRWTKGGVSNLLQAEANLSDLPDIAAAKATLALGNVDNTSDANKPVSVAQAAADALKQSLTGKDASGGYAGLTLLKLNLRNAANTFTNFFTSASTAARTWTLPDRTGTLADNTDLALKANLASPTFTGTVVGITATMVGLGSVNNTADSVKPVSTAQATAIAASTAANTSAAAAKATPVDADEMPITDSAAAFVLKKLTWANLKATLLAYFVGIFMKFGSSQPFRNRKVNGNFSVSQEFGTVSTSVVAGAALKYVVDQYYAFCTGANVTAQQITLADNTNRLRITGLAGNLTVGVGQRMPVAHTADMAGANATLSVKLSSSSITTVNWQAYYATTADAFGTLASPTRTSIASGSFNGVGVAEAVFSAQIAVPSAAKTGIEVVYSTGPLTAGNTLTFGEDQFEPLAIAPGDIVFERLDAPNNIARCQWFWRISAASIRFPATAGSQYGSSAFTFNPMRVTPVVGPATGGSQANSTTTTLTASSNYHGRMEIVSTATGDAYTVDYVFPLNARL